MKSTYIKELVITTEEIETIKKGLEKLSEFMDNANDLEIDLFDNWEMDTVSRMLNDICDEDFLRNIADVDIIIKEAE